MTEPIRRILMATDFSDYSRDALDRAVQMAKAFGAEIHLLHVLELPYTSTPPQYAKALEEVNKEEAKKLNTQAERIRQESIEVRLMSRHGVPHQQITEAAKEIRADLIVLGTHGRTGLAHMLIGSVAERVVRHAPCPVLTVKPKAPPH